MHIGPLPADDSAYFMSDNAHSIGADSVHVHPVGTAGKRTGN